MNPAALPDLPRASCVLYAVGYDRNAGHSMREVYVEGLRSVLEVVPSSARRVLYVSSTGVYGQAEGRWVDEQSDCQPTRQGGQVCLEAERLLEGHRLGARSIILRMAGIYGPGRVPRRDELLSGRSIVAPEQGYLNLIHVDDAVRVILAAEKMSHLPNLFLVSDGHPVTRREYCRHLAQLAGASRVRFENPPGDSPKAQRASADKRIRNTRMVEQLQMKLAYPSYREGLAAIMERP